MPLMATRVGAALQLQAGVRSHTARFGACGGFWLPECGYRPGLEFDAPASTVPLRAQPYAPPFRLPVGGRVRLRS